jgi:hypothetical protein
MGGEARLLLTGVHHAFHARSTALDKQFCWYAGCELVTTPSQCRKIAAIPAHMNDAICAAYLNVGRAKRTVLLYGNGAPGDGIPDGIHSDVVVSCASSNLKAAGRQNYEGSSPLWQQTSDP